LRRKFARERVSNFERIRKIVSGGQTPLLVLALELPENPLKSSIQARL
jgi:hypothetical protein